MTAMTFIAVQLFCFTTSVSKPCVVKIMDCAVERKVYDLTERKAVRVVYECIKGDGK